MEEIDNLIAEQAEQMRAQKPRKGEHNSVWTGDVQSHKMKVAEMSDYMAKGIRGDKLDPYEFIIPGLQRKSVAVFGGGGGGGKSQHNLQTAVSLACGIDIFGFYGSKKLDDNTDKPNDDNDDWEIEERNVIYVTIEDDAETMNRRLYNIFNFLAKNKNKPMFKNLDLESIKKKVEERLTILDLSGQGSRAWFAGPSISEAERREIIKNAAEAFSGNDLAIVDTLRRSHSFDENDNSGAAVVMATFEEIACAANCAIILIGHTNKDASLNGNLEIEGFRGSSVFKDNSRWGAMLAPLGVQKTPKGQKIEIDEYLRKGFVRFGIPKANKIAPFREFWLERGLGGVLFGTDKNVPDLIRRSIAGEPIDEYAAAVLAADRPQRTVNSPSARPKTARPITTKSGRA